MKPARISAVMLSALLGASAFAAGKGGRLPNLYQPSEEIKKQVEDWYYARARDSLAAEAAAKRMKDFTAWYLDRHDGRPPSKKEFAAEYKAATLDVRRSRVRWGGPDEISWHQLKPDVAASWGCHPDDKEKFRVIEVSGQYLLALKDEDSETLAVYEASAGGLLDDRTLSGTLKHETFHRFLYDAGMDKNYCEDHHELMMQYETRR